MIASEAIIRAAGKNVSGTSGDDTYKGTNDADQDDLSQGGNDTVRTLDGDDNVSFGATFTEQDFVDGGAGFDTVGLVGGAPVEIGAATMRGVENLALGSGHAYDITLRADFLTAADTFQVTQFTLDAGATSLRFDGSDTAAKLTIYGSAGDDVVIGGSGNDQFNLQSGGGDIVRGLGGDDGFNFGATFTRHDFVDGGDGYDRVVLDSADYTLRLTSALMEDVELLALGSGHTYALTISPEFQRADQTFQISTFTEGSGPGSLTLDGSATAGKLIVSGTAGDDQLTGGSNADSFQLFLGGKDVVSAGAGDDLVNYGVTFGNGDQVDGGAGSDTLVVSGGLAATLSASIVKNVELIALSAGFAYNLKLAADLVGAGQALTIYTFPNGGGPTSVAIDGSRVAGALVLLGSAGDDVMTGGSGNDFFVGTAGTDTINGGAGADRIGFLGAAVGVHVDLNIRNTQNTGVGSLKISNVENIGGSRFADVLIGDSKDNLLLGNGGADQLSGGDGNDMIVIGPDDAGVVASGIVVSGGAGRDLLSFGGGVTHAGGATVDLSASGAQDTGQGIVTVSGVEDLYGTGLDDRLTGSSAANTVMGGSGADTLSGGGGNDALYGDREATLAGPVDAAAPGADILIGGKGADTLGGGAGADAFVYQALSDSTVPASDTILDFADGVDRIDLSAIDADPSAGAPGDQAFHLGSTPGRVGDVVVSYDAAADRTTLSLFVDTDATPDAAIVLVGDHSGMTVADFVF